MRITIFRPLAFNLETLLYAQWFIYSPTQINLVLRLLVSLPKSARSIKTVDNPLEAARELSLVDNVFMVQLKEVPPVEEVLETAENN